MSDPLPPASDDMLPLYPSQSNREGANFQISGSSNDASGRDFFKTITYSTPSVMTCPPMPSKPDHFGGRNQELDELAALITDRRTEGRTVAITALYGTGGLGKTTLAKMLAHRLRDEDHFGVVIWAEVTRTPDLVMILETWARYGDSHYQAPRDVSSDKMLTVLRDEAKTRLAKAIKFACEDCASERVLLVLDDVWDKATADILRGARPDGATVLITTRLETLADDLGAQVQKIDFLEEDQAAELLETYLPQAHISSLQAVGRALNGHPLALRLAAQRARKEARRPGQTLDTVLTKHAHEYRIGLPTNTPFATLKLEQGETKDENLSKSLYYSYEALSQADRMRFRALGVLALGALFDVNLLAALWDLAVDEVEEKGCDSLRERSLIEATDVAGIYRLHPLLRAYAGALLREADEVDVVFGRYADHLIQVVAQFETLKPEFWWPLDAHLPHIHLVGDILCKQYEAHPDQTIWAQRLGNFTWNVKKYVYYRPQMVESTRGSERRGFYWFETALKVYQQQRHLERMAAMLSDIGAMWGYSADHEKALTYFEQALPVRREAGDKSGEALTLHNIGGVWRNLGYEQKALDFLTQSLLLIQQVGDGEREALILNAIGNAWLNLGDKKQALEFFNQALALARLIGDKASEAAPLANIGRIWEDLGDKLKAMGFYNQALSLARVVGNKRDEAITLSNIGNIFRVLGNTQKALDFCNQALPLVRIVGDKTGEASVLTNLGRVWEDLADTQKALSFYNEALALVSLLDDKLARASVISLIAKVWEDLGDKHKALNLHNEALLLTRSMSNKVHEGPILNNIGKVWEDLGDKQKSLDFYTQALALARQIDNKVGEGAVLGNIGKVWEDLGDKQKALDFYTQALPLMTNRVHESVICFNVANIYRHLGNLNQATEYMERCVAIDEQIKRSTLAQNRQELAQLKRELAQAQRIQQKAIAPFLALYRASGETAVRQQMATMGMTSLMIDSLIGQLRVGEVDQMPSPKKGPKVGN